MRDPALFRKLLIVGIVANLGVVALICLDKNEVSTSPSITWKTYYSDKLGYNVKYPGDWAKREFDIPDVETEARFIRSKDTYFSMLYSLDAAKFANLFRSKADKLKDPLIVSCHNAVVDGLAKRFKGIVKLESSEMKVGDTSAPLESYGTTFMFRMRRGLMARKMEGVVITTWNGSKPVSLLMVCPECDYKDVRSLFDEYAMSFKPGRVYSGGSERPPGSF